MRYSFISAAFLALASSVLAQTAGFDAITSPTQDQNIPAGSSFDIVWQPGTVTGTITITLLQGGTPSTLQAGAVIAKSIDNTLGKYTWSVPSSNTYPTYGFEITLDSTASSSSPTLQYSFPFHITGGTSSSASGSSSGSASGTGTPSTTTMHLSTGPNYSSSSAVATSTSTSLIPSSTMTVVSTSMNNTSTSATLKPSSSSNVTLSTLKSTATKTAASTGSSSTSSGASAASTNAAVSNIATGGLAMVGGIVLAFAL